MTNASASSAYIGISALDPIAFGPDTPLTNLHAPGDPPAQIFAGVDIDDLTVGKILTMSPDITTGFNPSTTTWYLAAKPFDVVAGRDIVGTGTTPDVFFNGTANDISLLQAGRDIYYQSVIIAGQGLLQVQAGRNLYQGYYGSLTSVGDIVNTLDATGGAGITVLTGVGANGPDYAAFAKLYFDPANQLPTADTPLAGSGEVVQDLSAAIGQLVAAAFWLYGECCGCARLLPRTAERPAGRVRPPDLLRRADARRAANSTTRSSPALQELFARPRGDRNPVPDCGCRRQSDQLFGQPHDVLGHPEQHELRRRYPHRVRRRYPDPQSRRSDHHRPSRA